MNHFVPDDKIKNANSVLIISEGALLFSFISFHEVFKKDIIGTTSKTRYIFHENADTFKTRGMCDTYLPNRNCTIKFELT